MQIQKIVIWGHKLHSHTHSYIHAGFYKAFQYLGYDTYWFDKNDSISNFDFTGSLFLTEGQVIENMPLRNDCFYILHNVDYDKHKSIPENRKIIIQVYTTDCNNRDIPDKERKFHYYCNNTLYFPWATDLLPHEIDENIKNCRNHKTEKTVNFIGMTTPPWTELSKKLKKHNIKFQSFGGTFKTVHKNNKDFEENMKLIQTSIIAPSLQTKWQVEHGYIPCRIFKNISYGKMGVTNNPYVNELFENKLIYNDNIEELTKQALKFEENPNKFDIIVSLMENVRDNHTYLNRIKYIKEHLEIIDVSI